MVGACETCGSIREREPELECVVSMMSLTSNAFSIDSIPGEKMPFEGIPSQPVNSLQKNTFDSLCLHLKEVKVGGPVLDICCSCSSISVVTTELISLHLQIGRTIWHSPLLGAIFPPSPCGKSYMGLQWLSQAKWFDVLLRREIKRSPRIPNCTLRDTIFLRMTGRELASVLLFLATGPKATDSGCSCSLCQLLTPLTGASTDACPSLPW